MSETLDKNPGSPFRVQREKLGLSIHDVAIATKISPRILKALEDGDRDGLPPHSFARGFIRSYASYLKIDAQPILANFNLKEAVTVAQANINTSETNIPTGNKPREVRISVPNDPTFNSKMFISAGLLILVLLIFGIKELFDKYAQERVIAPSAIEAEETPTDIVVKPSETDEKNQKDNAAQPFVPTANEAAKSADVSAQPKVTEATEANTNAKPVDSAAAKPEVANPTKPADALTEKSATINSTTAPTGASATSTATSPTGPDVPPKVEKPVATKQEILIEALDKVSIEVSVDGGELTKITLSPESVHTIKAKKSIQVQVSDGGMINIIHNGRDKGVPGDLGRPIKLKYP